MSDKMFENEATRIEVQDPKHNFARYSFNDPSKYLLLWSRLFQTVVSQAASRLVGNGFHTGDGAIYKCEGGCRVAGVDDLVLLHDGCCWDFDKAMISQLKQCADLISHIVLEWDPEDPIHSMLKAAADYIDVSVEELRAAIDDTRGINPFSGNSLSSFFNRNPFSDLNYDEDYRRWCLINYDGQTSEEVDELFAKEALAKELRGQLTDAARAHNDFVVFACSAKQMDNGEWKFWLNDGASIYGWRSEEEVRDLINELQSGAVKSGH